MGRRRGEEREFPCRTFQSCSGEPIQEKMLGALAEDLEDDCATSRHHTYEGAERNRAPDCIQPPSFGMSSDVSEWAHS
jgi:hypothetical protein